MSAEMTEFTVFKYVHDNWSKVLTFDSIVDEFIACGCPIGRIETIHALRNIIDSLLLKNMLAEYTIGYNDISAAIYLPVKAIIHDTKRIRNRVDEFKLYVLAQLDEVDRWILDVNGLAESFGLSPAENALAQQAYVELYTDGKIKMYTSVPSGHVYVTNPNIKISEFKPGQNHD